VSKDRPRNLPKSVRDRLTAHAREKGEEFQLVLTRYALERLLYRISRSAHGAGFVLKGAMLFALWTEQPHRPTKDLDLLGSGEPAVGRFEQIFREVCGAAVEDDGLVFDPATVRGERIKEDQEYEGLRLTFVATLERARIPLQIDIGFGDAVTPAAVAVAFPTILDFPTPALMAYPRETVVAEKFQAMVALGIANSRMKDFYDLWVLARRFAFDGAPLAAAIRATFERRKTAVPAAAPLALTAAFTDDAAKNAQWQGFVRKSRLPADGTALPEIATALRAFLLPPAEAVRTGAGFARTWTPGGPWD
jgi:predicted nucleotidyltransferase component of viral defense system